MAWNATSSAEGEGMAEVVRRRLRITGQVQGVFFRAATREVARREGVTGWVQNMPDRAVVAELQGPPEAVHAVEAFCQDGPAGARVADLIAVDIDVLDGESGFDTR
ncbi:MAG TPA: acylphosphatase [Euzebya sp.]|nr:acylphosphatase [Euzebya sp.]